jgi:hypothetical protein
MPLGYNDKALEEAGQAGGEYLDHIKKTDLASLTQEQYTTFITTIIGRYYDVLNKDLENDLPF